MHSGLAIKTKPNAWKVYIHVRINIREEAEGDTSERLLTCKALTFITKSSTRRYFLNKSRLPGKSILPLDAFSSAFP